MGKSIVSLLFIFLFFFKINAQCANSHSTYYEKVSLYEKSELRKFDKALVRSVGRAFHIKQVRGFYVDDIDYENGKHIGIAYAEKKDENDDYLSKKFGETDVGFVVLGKRFASDFLTPINDDGKQTIALLTNFLVAHEVAHLVQYKGDLIKSEGGWKIDSINKYPTRLKELNADFAGGFHIGNNYLRKNLERYHSGKENRESIKKRIAKIIRSISKYVYAIGDTHVESTNHHGTPEQRLAQFRKGLDLGINNYYVKEPIHKWMQIDWDCLKKNAEECIKIAKQKSTAE